MDTFLQAGAYLVDPVYWVAVSIAIALAIVVGIVPGVGSLLVMALMIPFVLFKIDDPAIAIVMLATITGVNNTLDSIPAVLVGLPSGATQVTFLEGHQLARRGLGAYTLGAVYAVSAIGGVVNVIDHIVDGKRERRQDRCVVLVHQHRTILALLYNHK